MSRVWHRKHKNFLHDLGMRWRIFIYLLGFAVIMVVLLWLMQIVYLDNFYERIKEDQIQAAYNNIAFNIDDEELPEYVEEVALKYNLCASLYSLEQANGLNMGTEKIISIHILSNCIIHNVDSSELTRIYMEAIQNPDGYMEIFTLYSFGKIETEQSFFSRLIVADNESEPKSLVYAGVTEDEQGERYLILLNSTITPVSATVATLRIQLIVITGVLIAMALVLSLMIARRLARPISDLNEAAKDLAAGDLSGNFPAGGYQEISELAETLNYASSELSRTDNLQKDIVANISHDIRTPLMMIGGYAEYMRDFPDEDHQESIEVIIDETGRLRDLVNDILDNSKMSSGTGSMDAQLINFSESLQRFIGKYNILLEPQGYRIDLSSAKDVLIKADEKRLHQALGNMLNNALTHIGADKIIQVRLTSKNRIMRVEIEDHGPGISKEDLAHIWERYYRTDAPAKVYHGSGLGLSIVKNIMEMHKATYGVSSTLGQGSIFWFEIKTQAKPR